MMVNINVTGFTKINHFRAQKLPHFSILCSHIFSSGIADEVKITSQLQNFMKNFLKFTE